MDGSLWKVRYFSQVLGADQELSPQQQTLSPVYQQYRVINDLILSATQGLELSQDPESKSWDATGSSTVICGDVIPNKGDMFLADIGDGQEGIFAVTNSTKLTYQKDTLYGIEYTMVAESSSDPVRRMDLEQKIIQELVFVREHLATGENPIITKTEFVQRQEMDVAYKEMVDQYFQDFYSRDKSTLLVPGQPVATYDPFLTTFVRDIVGSTENHLVNFVDFPDVFSVPGMYQQTLWDPIRRLSQAMVRSVARRVGLLSTSYYRGQPHYAGAYYAGFCKVAYPLDPRADVDAPFDRCKPSPSGAIVAGDVRRGDITEYLSDPVDGFRYTEDAVDQLPYVVPVTHDNRYVFTEAFYKCVGPYSSQLERLTHQMLSHSPIDKALVLKIAKAAPRWPDLERFYYSPVVMALLKVSIRTS